MTEVGDVVTQVREREQRANPFREVLARPGALQFSAAAFLGRMPMSMFSLGTVLLIASVTGKYGVAGIVAAAGSLGYAVFTTQAARLADRFGQRRVLRPMVVFFAAATIALIACAEFRAPLWTMVAAGWLAGTSMPSLSSMVRARWSALLGDSPLLHTAFALESILDETIFVIGPALVTVLATEVQPATGVAVAMAACVTGTLLFAAQRRTQPITEHVTRHAGKRKVLPQPVRRRSRRRPRRPAGGRPERMARGGVWGHGVRGVPGKAECPPEASTVLPAPGLVTAAPVYFCLGVMFSTIDLSTVAFAQQHGHKPLAGFILGAYALGSAVGGICYGSRTWRAPVYRRFTVTLCAVSLGTATFWAMPGLGALAGVIFCSGLGIAPTAIAGVSLIEQQAPAGRRTEGMAWLTSAISVGVAVGSAVAGHLIDAGGARWGYVFAAACGGTALAVCLLGQRWLRRPAGAEWADARE